MAKWTAFPHLGDYSFDAASLKKHWPRLHAGDAEPLPQDLSMPDPPHIPCQAGDIGRQQAGDFVFDDIGRAAGVHRRDGDAERARFDQHAAQRLGPA